MHINEKLGSRRKDKRKRGRDGGVRGLRVGMDQIIASDTRNEISVSRTRNHVGSTACLTV